MRLSPAQRSDAAVKVAAVFAVDVLGTAAVPGTTAFDSMILALSMHAHGNTEAETIRLNCAKWARRNRKAYLAEIEARRAKARLARRHPGLGMAKVRLDCGADAPEIETQLRARGICGEAAWLDLPPIVKP